MIGRLLLLVLGVFACSTAVIMIKASTTEPLTLTAIRLLLAAIVLTPVFANSAKRAGRPATVATIRRAVLPGALLAIHFGSWIYGARLTPAANSALVVNLVPAVMPIFAIFLLREKPVAVEYLATAICLVGVGVLAWGDLDFSPQWFKGDLVCFGSMLGLTAYLALARRGIGSGDVWLYVIPVYWIAGGCALLAALLTGRLQFEPTAREIWLAVGLGIVPTIIGHGSLNYCMKVLRAQLVSLVNLTQFVFAGIMGYIFFREIPNRFFWIAVVLVLPGCLLAIRSSTKHRQEAASTDG